MGIPKSRILTYVKAFNLELDKHLRETKGKSFAERVKLARAAFPTWTTKTVYRRRLWNHCIKRVLGLKKLRDAAPPPRIKPSRKNS